MSLPILFLPAAQAEFNEAATWYEEQRQGLGDEFIAEVEEVFTACLKILGSTQ